MHDEENLMNTWQCSTEGCITTATGVGGGIGLVAIGWHFTRGVYDSSKGMIAKPLALCPIHYPGEDTCDVDMWVYSIDTPCIVCAARHAAHDWQQVIKDTEVKP